MQIHWDLQVIVFQVIDSDEILISISWATSRRQIRYTELRMWVHESDTSNQVVHSYSPRKAIHPAQHRHPSILQTKPDPKTNTRAERDPLGWRVSEGCTKQCAADKVGFEVTLIRNRIHTLA